ncbi:hypothetical protein QCA50_009517 [Cerrena zonata]|uniref:Uncharacterized protein n=1 Tax=Cerrena zonata TaxID=2478898 RepID=A0AAW0GAS5_9APHY
MEIKDPHPLLKINAVKQARPLTERSWTNIQGVVVSFMQEWANKRLATVRYERLEHRIGVLKSMMVWYRQDLGLLCPEVSDIVLFPDIREIMESPLASVDDVREPSALATSLFRKKIVELVIDQRQGKKKRLCDLIESATETHVPDDIDVLDLAISKAFVCCHCQATFHNITETTRDLLSHWCLYKARQRHKNDRETDLDYNDMATSITSRHPWSCDELKLQVELFKRIIHCYGEDSMLVTADVLDKKDIRLRCQVPACNRNPKTARLMFSWRAAVSEDQLVLADTPNLIDPYTQILHFVKRHPIMVKSEDHLKVLLTTADPTEAQQIVHLEAAVREEQHRSPSMLRYCLKCPEKRWHGPSSAVEKHCKNGKVIVIYNPSPTKHRH